MAAFYEFDLDEYIDMYEEDWEDWYAEEDWEDWILEDCMDMELPIEGLTECYAWTWDEECWVELVVNDEWLEGDCWEMADAFDFDLDDYMEDDEDDYYDDDEEDWEDWEEED